MIVPASTLVAVSVLMAMGISGLRRCVILDILQHKRACSRVVEPPRQLRDLSNPPAGAAEKCLNSPDCIA